ncbi:unnamed protein product, partial [Ectocarpus fasciculatus]
VPPSEYSALQSLYDSTNGEHWVWANYSQQWNFTGVHDPCLERWEGVYCAEPCRDGNSPDCAVVGLDLRLHNMSGTLPTSLQDFHNITLLDLSYNFIKGVIPAEIGELTTLVILDLSYLCLSGAIPSEIAGTLNLEMIDLAVNFLTSTLPPSLATLRNLTVLDLSQNRVWGTIPNDYYTGMKRLEILDLGFN